MRHRARLVARLAAVVLLGLLSGTSQIARAANPGYLTLSFGRTQWVTAKNCVALPLRPMRQT